jgi:hypothetical protein
LQTKNYLDGENTWKIRYSKRGSTQTEKSTGIARVHVWKGEWRGRWRLLGLLYNSHFFCRGCIGGQAYHVTCTTTWYGQALHIRVRLRRHIAADPLHSLVHVSGLRSQDIGTEGAKIQNQLLDCSCCFDPQHSIRPLAHRQPFTPVFLTPSSSALRNSPPFTPPLVPKDYLTAPSQTKNRPPNSASSSLLMYSSQVRGLQSSPPRRGGRKSSAYFALYVRALAQRNSRAGNGSSYRP